MDEIVPHDMRDHARHLRTRSHIIADFALRYGSPQALSLLALRASYGRSGYATLLREMRELRTSGDVAQIAPINLEGLAATAKVKAGRPGPDGDLTEAADLYQALRLLRAAARPGDGSLATRDADRLDAQTNLATSRIDYVARILPELQVADEPRWMLTTDVLNPAHDEHADEAEWLRSFNQIFEMHGLTPIALAAGVGAPFDHVMPAQQPVAAAGDGPSVSIVMSVFKPDQSLVTALRSLTDQTWPHLQVLVFDDCSPPQYQALIHDAVAMDDRIELHRMPSNGGTYKIRNAAIARARGEFIAFQDSDDWSHPERIQRQLQPLLDDETMVATLSRSVRVNADLTTIKVGYPALRRNMSSLLFRREAVLSELGGFDEVRKSGDGEFIGRLERVFGINRIRSLTLPLMLVQLTGDSLTRGDFRLGWHDGNRVGYRQAFEFWHSLIADGRSTARLDPAGPRPFPAPNVYLAGSSEHHCDVALVSDWRAGISRYAGVDAEARALARAGMSTVQLHAEAARHALRGRKPPSRLSMRLRADGVVPPARWEDQLHTDLVLVRDPELMVYPRGGPVGVRAGRVVLYAGYQTRAPDGGWLVYDPAVVEESAREMFGAEPEWLPANPHVAAALVGDGAKASILPARLLGVVPVRRRLFRGRIGGDRMVVGTSRLETGVGDRPSMKQLRALLPDDDRYDVRVRDSDDVLGLATNPRACPPNWLVTGSTGLAGFLDQLDVFVGMPMRSWGPEPAHEAAAAIARGCVAVLDPAYESQFGPAALYTNGRSTRQVIDALRRSRVKHEAQQRIGYDWCEDNLSALAYTDAVRILLHREPRLHLTRDTP